MAEVSGVSIGQIFQSSTSSLEKEGKDLQAKLLDIGKDGKELSQMELLKMQYAMGQYNAKMEAVSASTKSLLDTLKSLAQRQG